MPVILGGPTARKVWSRGEFGLSLQYVGLPGQEAEEALCIWPLRRTTGDKSGAFVVCLSAAWQYADSKTGGPTKHCIIECMKALQIMRMPVLKDTVIKLADLIVEEIPELLRMKPQPDDGQKFEGELAINGRSIGIVVDEDQTVH